MRGKACSEDHVQMKRQRRLYERKKIFRGLCTDKEKEKRKSGKMRNAKTEKEIWGYVDENRRRKYRQENQ